MASLDEARKRLGAADNCLTADDFQGAFSEAFTSLELAVKAAMEAFQVSYAPRHALSPGAISQLLAQIRRRSSRVLRSPDTTAIVLEVSTNVVRANITLHALEGLRGFARYGFEEPRSPITPEVIFGCESMRVLTQTLLGICREVLGSLEVAIRLYGIA